MVLLQDFLYTQFYYNKLLLYIILYLYICRYILCIHIIIFIRIDFTSFVIMPLRKYNFSLYISAFTWIKIYIYIDNVVYIMCIIDYCQNTENFTVFWSYQYKLRHSIEQCVKQNRCYIFVYNIYM